MIITSLPHTKILLSNLRSFIFHVVSLVFSYNKKLLIPGGKLKKWKKLMKKLETSQTLDMVDHCTLTGFIDDEINYTFLLNAFLHFKMPMYGISCTTLFKSLYTLVYTAVQKFLFLFKLFFNILFRKDTISWSKIIVKTFVMQKNIYISNKCYSIKESWKNVHWFLQKY